MRPRLAIIRIVALSASLGHADTQPADLSDRAFMQASVVVMTFDHLAGECRRRGGWAAQDAQTIESWKTAHSVDLVRKRLAELAADPQQQRAIEGARATMTKQFTDQRVDHCASALNITRRPEAQFATAFPDLLAALRDAPKAAIAKTPSPDAATNPSARAAAPTASPGDSRARERVLRDIDSFGFHSRMTMGFGGALMLDIYPIVLFKNGDALRDVAALGGRLELAAHKRAHPDEWTRWQRSGDQLQIAEEKGGWKPLHFQETYATLPPDFRLNGFFRALSGTGNVAIGGTDSVAAWREYTFSPDGSVVRGGGVGSYGASGDASVATSIKNAGQRGRYRIDGLTLTITYDDGSQQSHILVTNPKDPRGAIWLDGVGYVRRNR